MLANKRRSVFAFTEAQAHLEKGLEWIKALPESPERGSRELTLQVALGAVMVATRGWSGSDTAAVYKRAWSLAGPASPAESLEAFWGLYTTVMTRGELRAGLGLADQVVEIAQGMRSARALVSVYHAQGFSRFCLGDLTVARQGLRQAIEHYREDDFRGIPFDLGVNARVFAGINEWFLGCPDEARRDHDNAYALARDLNKPFSLAQAVQVGSWTAGLRVDFARVRSAAEEAQRLSTEYGFPVTSAESKIVGPWAGAQMGKLGGAMDSIRAGLAELDAISFFLVAASSYPCWAKRKRSLAPSMTPSSRLSKRWRPIPKSCGIDR